MQPEQRVRRVDIREHTQRGLLSASTVTGVRHAVQKESEEVKRQGVE